MSGQGMDHIMVIQWWILLCISGNSAEVMKRSIFFISGQTESVHLSVSDLAHQSVSDLAQPHGSEFSWEWTSHNGRYSEIQIARAISSRLVVSPPFTEYFSCSIDYDVTVKPKFECAGVFLLVRTNVPLVKIEIFAIKITPSFWPSFRLGSDVSVSCEVSSLPEGATLQWEREEGPTSNTTLSCNNTVHMVIHSVHPDSQGAYYCTFRQNGTLLYNVSNAVRIEEVSSDATLTMYRESSNSSLVTLLCMTSDGYTHASWSWTPLSTAKEVQVVTTAMYGSNDPFNERFSFGDFNGHSFPLYFSPVKFEDCGRFNCYFENLLVASINVVTLKVSAVQPSGFPRNHPVVLRCEVSEVSGDPVTLAWMRMEGSRGLLVKQDVLTETGPNRTLSVTLPSLRSDQLHWQCVVFTEGVLRVTASLTLTLPTKTTMSSMTGMGTETVVRGVITMAATLGILGLLGFYCRRPNGTQAQRQKEEPAQLKETSV
ncbi:uncharacterized protein LOC115160882 isoform X1 [Salmo trutta]|uniref:uncharacterized protein LOC115160882 isoform X1 n=1 Tax=Salmo trutta TaxID=8032 RepID=UPI0011316AAA|nr:uncharacterized protein LOC115160882 isoform X1 [Salmo trutta]